MKTLIALMLGALIGAAAPAAAQDTIRHGIQIGALGALRTTLPLVAAKHNLKYDIKDFTDSTAALRALEQGELEIANTTAQHLVRALTEGIDVVWVAGWGGGYNVLVARQQFKVAAGNPAALKAAIDQRKGSSPVKIGVPTGSLQHAKLLGYLRAAKIDPDKDVQIVNVPFPNHPRALEAGEVDLAMTLAGFGSLAMEKSNAQLVQHLFDAGSGKQEIGFIVHRRLIQQKPELVQRIVDSHVEAMKLFVGNMEKQVEFEKKYSRFPDSVVQKTERTFLRYDYRTNVADLKTMAREMQQLGWAKEDLSPKIDGAIDLRFLAKATGQNVDSLTRW
jgi:NitT/TauT family transport system substrate-binding protein